MSHQELDDAVQPGARGGSSGGDGRERRIPATKRVERVDENLEVVRRDVLEERALPGVDAGDATIIDHHRDATIIGAATTARVLVHVLVGPVVFVHLRVGVDVLAFDGSILIALIRVLVDILVAFVVVVDILAFVFVVRVRG